jgi:hypothetical protein
MEKQEGGRTVKERLGVRRLDGAWVWPIRPKTPHQSGVEPPQSKSFAKVDARFT